MPVPECAQRPRDLLAHLRLQGANDLVGTELEARKRQIERFHEFHHLLRQNTAQKAADAVLEVLENRR